jgi:hypothetical protein
MRKSDNHRTQKFSVKISRGGADGEKVMRRGNAKSLATLCLMLEAGIKKRAKKSRWRETS